MSRPLLSIDIEATGVDPAKDRIIEFAICNVATHEAFQWTVNPGIPIPAEATAIHGISDADVKSLPLFEAFAHDIYLAIKDCDLLGFGLRNFDIPLLWEELYRAGYSWDLRNTNVIDAGVIFKKREERSLSAAHKFYCGTELENAHGAMADAKATARVLGGMVFRYQDLDGMSAEELAKASEYDDAQPRVDLAGKIVIGKDGRPTYAIGKAKGVAVVDDPGFGRWMLDKDFTQNTKAVIRDILEPKSESMPLFEENEIPF